MAAEQTIRVSAKGEFGQLQRGLKQLQQDLKGVSGVVDKGAGRGGFFDEKQTRALELYKRRFMGTMNELNAEFRKQNDVVEALYSKMSNAQRAEREEIRQTISQREKQLDVLRKEIMATERLYNQRSKESNAFGRPPSSSKSSGDIISGGDGRDQGSGGGILSGLMSAGKFAFGLAGLTGIASLATKAYDLSYERVTGSLDLAQRLRGQSGWTGNATDMWDRSGEAGRSDRMGYTAAESWGFLEQYSRIAGAISAGQQQDLLKFGRGYGLNTSEVAGVVGANQAIGGTQTPKGFADAIAGSVAKSGMTPRILEVMETNNALLSQMNTTLKDGSSKQILAYQTTLDRIGVDKGMTQLTGAQGGNLIAGLGGIFQPGNDKWKWMGIQALQDYNPQKYGKKDLFDLEMSYEDGLMNADNIPAMAKYIRSQTGGNKKLDKYIMQRWLTDGGYAATKREASEFYDATDGLTKFSPDQIEALKNGSIDSGEKYTSERKNERGQEYLDTDARFSHALEQIGTPIVQGIMGLKDAITTGMEDVLNTISEGDSNSKAILSFLTNHWKELATVAGVAIVADNVLKVAAAIGLLKGVTGLAGMTKFMGALGVTAGVVTGTMALDDYFGKTGINENVQKIPEVVMDDINRPTINNKTKEDMNLFSALSETAKQSWNAITDKETYKNLKEGLQYTLDTLSLKDADKLADERAKGDDFTPKLTTPYESLTNPSSNPATQFENQFRFLPLVNTAVEGSKKQTAESEKLHDDVIAERESKLIQPKDGSSYNFDMSNNLDRQISPEGGDILGRAQRNEKLSKSEQNMLAEWVNEFAARKKKNDDAGDSEIGRLTKNMAGGIENFADTGITRLRGMDRTTRDMADNASDKYQSMEKNSGSLLDKSVYLFRTMYYKVANTMDYMLEEHRNMVAEFSGSSRYTDGVGGDYASGLGQGYKITQNSRVSVQDLNKQLKGFLAGYGADYVKAGNKYGIDPAFLVAVSMQETGGTSPALKNKNNVGGMMGKNGLLSFKSIPDGIDAMAKNIANNYVPEGIDTVEKVQQKYAPIGATNDPDNLNNDWSKGVTSILSNLLGNSRDGMDSGYSFFKGWENRVTSRFGDKEGFRLKPHGGLDINGEQGDALDALTSGKVSFIKMDDGGPNDPDGKANTTPGGSTIGIKMSDGNTYYYAHLSDVNSKLKVGDNVAAGEWLGNMGGDKGVAGSGSSTTGSHLHLGYMDKDGVLMDPVKLLNGLNAGDSEIGKMNPEQFVASAGMSSGSSSPQSQQIVTTKSEITVKLDLTGEGAKILNNATPGQLEKLVNRIMTERERQRLRMSPTKAGYS